MEWEVVTVSVDGPYQGLRRISAKGTRTRRAKPTCSSESEGLSVRTPTGHATLGLRTCGNCDFDGDSCCGLNANPTATTSDYESISGISTVHREICHMSQLLAAPVLSCSVPASMSISWRRNLCGSHALLSSVASPRSSRCCAREYLHSHISSHTSHHVHQQMVRERFGATRVSRVLRCHDREMNLHGHMNEPRKR